MDAQIINAGALAGAILAVFGVLVALQRAVSWLLRTLRKLGEFLEDWAGETPRPGVAGRLGVMARLERIEARLPLDHAAPAPVNINIDAKGTTS